MLKRKYRYIVLGFITIILFSIVNVCLITFNLVYQSNKNRITILKKENILTEEKQITGSINLNQNNIISKESQTEIQSETQLKIQPQTQLKKESENQLQRELENSNWKIVIPKIGLEAKIEQGTNLHILEKYVGHFENTSKFNGNIGLAAHNNTFFKNLKNIEIGDKIIYISEFGNKKYTVTSIEKIQETDWSKLAQTKENKITLITCVKNMPQLRLCVQ